MISRSGKLSRGGQGYREGWGREMAKKINFFMILYTFFGSGLIKKEGFFNADIFQKRLLISRHYKH
jgi:hypothetical protein